MKETKLKIRVTLTEEALGLTPANPAINEKYIASKAPDAPSKEEEVEALGIDDAIEETLTVFPRDHDGTPFFWDYQIKGAIKDSVGMLRRMAGSKSSKMQAYKKVIDGQIFVEPRRVRFSKVNGQIGRCQRSLRAQTAQGERICLADSEAVPTGSQLEFTVVILGDKAPAKPKKGDEEPAEKYGPVESIVREWLDYGTRRGLSQWRNSGKGTFTYEILS